MASNAAFLNSITLGNLSRSSGPQGGDDVNHMSIIRDANHGGKIYLTDIRGAAWALHDLVSHGDPSMGDPAVCT